MVSTHSKAMRSPASRARGGDRIASFGDFIGLSEPADESCARLIAREVSDGIVAPGYSSAALEILRKKKHGAYIVLLANPTYKSSGLDLRRENGLELQQAPNRTSISPRLFQQGVGALPPPSTAVADLQLATIVAKHTPSNAVCIAYDGQAIGIGGGQQARIHATRSACEKADLWRLQLHARAAAVASRHLPAPLTNEERRAWLSSFHNTVMSSDGYIPFPDNVHRAARSFVAVIAQPGGSKQDAPVTEVANRAGIAMVHTGLRLFWH